MLKTFKTSILTKLGIGLLLFSTTLAVYNANHKRNTPISFLDFTKILRQHPIFISQEEIIDNIINHIDFEGGTFDEALWEELGIDNEVTLDIVMRNVFPRDYDGKEELPDEYSHYLISIFQKNITVVGNYTPEQQIAILDAINQQIKNETLFINGISVGENTEWKGMYIDGKIVGCFRSESTSFTFTENGTVEIINNEVTVIGDGKHELGFADLNQTSTIISETGNIISTESSYFPGTSGVCS